MAAPPPVDRAAVGLQGAARGPAGRLRARLGSAGAGGHGGGQGRTAGSLAAAQTPSIQCRRACREIPVEEASLMMATSFSPPMNASRSCAAGRARQCARPVHAAAHAAAQAAGGAHRCGHPAWGTSASWQAPALPCLQVGFILAGLHRHAAVTLALLSGRRGSMLVSSRPGRQAGAVPPATRLRPSSTLPHTHRRLPRASPSGACGRSSRPLCSPLPAPQSAHPEGWAAAAAAPPPACGRAAGEQRQRLGRPPPAEARCCLPTAGRGCG